MSFRIPQLKCTLSPNVPRHPPPPGIMHRLEEINHAWGYLWRRLVHTFVVVLSIFLSTFVISGWFQIACVAMAIAMIPTFQVSMPSKIFMVFICMLLVCSRPLLEAFVSPYNELMRKEFFRQFVFCATVGHFIQSVIDVAVLVITVICVQLLRELYPVLKEAAVSALNGLWDEAEFSAPTNECFNGSNDFAKSYKFSEITSLIGIAISASVTPVLLISGYDRVTRAGGLEIGTDIEIVLKWAVTSAMGLFLSTKVFICLLWYPLDTQQTRDSKNSWGMIAGVVFKLVRLGLVQAGVFIYVGNVKAGVNRCFKCMSWAGVMWYLFGFHMIRVLLEWAQESLFRDMRKFSTPILRHNLALLLFLMICASLLVDAVFLYNVYSTLKASE